MGRVSSPDGRQGGEGVVHPQPRVISHQERRSGVRDVLKAADSEAQPAHIRANDRNEAVVLPLVYSEAL
jgi:hypothetical protein